MACPTCGNKMGGIPLWKCDKCGHVRCNSKDCSNIAGTSNYGENSTCGICKKGKLKKIK